MVQDVFDGYKDENNTDEIDKNTFAEDITRSKSNNLNELDSDVTRAIKNSIEMNSCGNIKDSETSFKQFLDLATNIVNEIPTMVIVTEKNINKMIEKGKEGIESINNLKNSMSYSCKDRSEKKYH